MESLTFGALEHLIFLVETSYKPKVYPSSFMEAIDELIAKEESDIVIKDFTKTLRMFVAYAAIEAQYYTKERSRNLTYLIGTGTVEQYVHKLKQVRHQIAPAELNGLVFSSVFIATHLTYAKKLIDTALSYTQQKIDSHHLNTTVEKSLVCGLSEISGQPVKDLIASVPHKSRTASYFAQPVRC